MQQSGELGFVDEAAYDLLIRVRNLARQYARAAIWSAAGRGVQQPAYYG